MSGYFSMFLWGCVFFKVRVIPKPLLCIHVCICCGMWQPCYTTSGPVYTATLLCQAMPCWNMPHIHVHGTLDFIFKVLASLSSCLLSQQVDLCLQQAQGASPHHSLVPSFPSLPTNPCKASLVSFFKSLLSWCLEKTSWHLGCPGASCTDTCNTFPFAPSVSHRSNRKVTGQRLPLCYLYSTEHHGLLVQDRTCRACLYC